MSNILKLCITALLVILTYVSCEKSIDSERNDNHYPTTYYKLSNSELVTRRAEYLANKNCKFTSSLDEFGFCSFYPYKNQTCAASCTTFNLDKAKTLTFDFFQNNKKYAGLVDTFLLKNLTFRSHDRGVLCVGIINNRWVLSTSNQQVENLEVMNSKISLELDDDGVVNASGHWYPFIYVPDREFVSYEKAKSLLFNKSFEFMCWSTIKMTITKSTVWDKPLARKIIQPVNLNDRIELHVVWVLRTDMFEFLVDTITGELISSYVTAICL